MPSYYPITALSTLPEYNNPVRLGVIGSRSYTNYTQLESYIVFLLGIYDVRFIVSGGKRWDAVGVDTLAENWADFNTFDKIIFPPKLKQSGNPEAYHQRNQRIAETSQIILAVKDVISGGTLDTVRRGLALNKFILWANYKNEVTWLKSI